MARCIYCLEDETTKAFTKREHVIPTSMGSFTPLNPTLLAVYGVVCDTCNGDIFSPLEVNFIEDSLEGVYGQRLNTDGRNSVTMRGNNFQIEKLVGFGDHFLDQMFFFLQLKDGKVVPVLKDQIKLKRFQGGYRVFLPEALETIKKDSSTFERIASDLQKLDQKDMAIFAESRERIDAIILLLKEFGVNYVEKETHGKELKPDEKIIVEENYTCTINHDIGRVLAKTAFNYFAYCAVQDGMTHLLYGDEFRAIREFTHADTGNLREIIPSINEEMILYQEREKNMRLHAHVINFLSEDGNIIVRMTFFGRSAIYKIIIGRLPNELNNEHFGCGHAFDPFSHQIMQLSQLQPEGQAEEQIRATFGLFKRNIKVTEDK